MVFAFAFGQKTRKLPADSTIDPSGKMKDRFSFKGYRSGHMMYLRAEDLISANDDLREFILKTIPKKGQPAKY